MSDGAAFRPCSLCRDDRLREFVLANHLAGVSPTRMEAISRSNVAGIRPVKSETIARHIRVCLPRTFVPDQGTAAKAIMPTRSPDDILVDRAARADRRIAKAATVMAREDVATLVQQQVVEKLRSGEARVTVQHGLQAQAILDRRDERAKDRALAITLTRLLHQPLAPSEIIDVTPVEADGP